MPTDPELADPGSADRELADRELADRELADRELARAAELLRGGGLVGLPTETVYGLAADATNPAAVARVFTAKGRPPGHPLIVHLARAADLGLWAEHVPDAAFRLAAACWPGPLTLVVRRGPGIADEVTGGRATIGLRVPDHPVALRLLDLVGLPLAAPSANRFGRVSPTTAADVRAGLGALVDLVLDGGPCLVGVESTIVDLVGDRPLLLRPGGVPVELVEEILGMRVEREDVGPARASGMLASHYAPRVAVELVSAEALADRAAALAGQGLRVAVLAAAPPGSAVLAGSSAGPAADAPGSSAGPAADAPGSSASAGPGLPDGVLVLDAPTTVAAYARSLYRRLHEADAAGADVLLAVAPPAEGLGLAVLDRLRRAAAPRQPAGG